MLYGIGLTDADLQTPQVAICIMWVRVNTADLPLDRWPAHQEVVQRRPFWLRSTDRLHAGCRGDRRDDLLAAARDLIADRSRPWWARSGTTA